MEYSECINAVIRESDYLIEDLLFVLRQEIKQVAELRKTGRLREGEINFLEAALYEHTLLLIGHRAQVDNYQSRGCLLNEHGQRCDMYNTFLDSALGEKRYGRYYQS